MKRFAALVFILALWPLAGTAFADTGGTNLPFKVSGSGTTNGGSAGTFTGSVGGVQLGKGSFNGSFTTLGFPPVCGSGFAPADISLTLTAADGSTLSTAGLDQFCWDTSQGFTFPVSGPYTIVGGTGRFANATGSGTMSGVNAYPGPPGAVPGTFTFTDTGTISLNQPAS